MKFDKLKKYFPYRRQKITTIVYPDVKTSVDNVRESVQQFLESCMRKAAEEISAEIGKDADEVYKEMRRIPVDVKDDVPFAQYEYINQVVEMNLKPIITLELAKPSQKLKEELNQIYDISVLEEEIMKFVVHAYKEAYKDRKHLF